MRNKGRNAEPEPAPGFGLRECSCCKRKQWFRFDDAGHCDECKYSLYPRAYGAGISLVTQVRSCGERLLRPNDPMLQPWWIN